MVYGGCIRNCSYFSKVKRTRLEYAPLMVPLLSGSGSNGAVQGHGLDRGRFSSRQSRLSTVLVFPGIRDDRRGSTPSYLVVLAFSRAGEQATEAVALEEGELAPSGDKGNHAVVHFEEHVVREEDRSEAVGLLLGLYVVFKVHGESVRIRAALRAALAAGLRRQLGHRCDGRVPFLVFKLGRAAHLRAAAEAAGSGDGGVRLRRVDLGVHIELGSHGVRLEDLGDGLVLILDRNATAVALLVVHVALVDDNTVVAATVVACTAAAHAIFAGTKPWSFDRQVHLTGLWLLCVQASGAG